MPEWRLNGEGSHWIADDGSVRSVKTGRRLHPSVAGNGYLCFGGAMVNGQRRTLFVHHQVAEAFIGDRRGLVVNHLDGDKLNNHVSNLELTTLAGNAAHAAAHGLSASGERHGSKTHPEAVPRGMRHHNAKLTDEMVAMIRSAVSQGRSCRSLALELGVSDGTVRRAARGIDWSHLSSPTAVKYTGRGEASGTAKLTSDLVRTIREEYAMGDVRQVALAKKYGVSQATISNIVLRKRCWEHLL